MKPRVLVAEHSVVVAKIIAGCLEKAGCEVVGICYDGSSALEKARLLRPDVVTFDLILPRLSGLQMAASLKRFEIAPTMMVISAVTSRSRIAAAKTLGVRYYVLKAVDAGKLTQLATGLVRELQNSPKIAS